MPAQNQCPLKHRKKYGYNEVNSKVEILHVLADDISHLQAHPVQRSHPDKQFRQIIYSVVVNSPPQRYKAALRKRIKNGNLSC